MDFPSLTKTFNKKARIPVIEIRAVN